MTLVNLRFPGMKFLVIYSLSPRGRGNPALAARKRCIPRSIPAWAGEPGFQLPVAQRLTVYPRVGGGTGQYTVKPGEDTGLSPRGRGNRPRKRPPGRVSRSIPAWAGEPSPQSLRACAKPVYPRVGGGTVGRAAPVLPGRGLSPRGRGNRWSTICRTGSTGSIPAWAGEPCASRTGYTAARVYPRVGGGTRCRPLPSSDERGLSPRGRGNL